VKTSNLTPSLFVLKLRLSIGGADESSHAFLASPLVGGEWSVSSPGEFALGEKDPCIHLIGDWRGEGGAGLN
jgi:hypothetical protein